MLNNDSNSSNIEKISSDELINVCGGESKTYSGLGVFASGIGDNVDIQEFGDGGISVRTCSSFISNSSCTSFSSSSMVV